MATILSLQDIHNAALSLDQIDRGLYPHGLDLRPIATFIANGWIGVCVTKNRELQVRLTQLGKKALLSAKETVGVTDK